ncbi:hypothetical protein [Bacteroides sedimenti]|uniref:Uncharacterized protein n=1 Tax=Bacteroides sedimenti TaxID=2136147 RepID=A0ABM8IF49_9BACE
MKRGDLLDLYFMTLGLNNGGLNPESRKKYILMRLPLANLAEEYERVRNEIADQTKPESWKEGDDRTEWDAAFSPIMREWLDEELDICPIMLTQEEAVALVANNALDGATEMAIVKRLTQE